MRIVLINPPIRTWSEPNVPPMGLLYLSSILRKEGYEVDIWDINGQRPSAEEVEARLADADYDVYGIGGIITTYASACRLTETIKKYHPNATVVWGGPLATSSYSRVLASRPDINAFILGEGEKAILDLVNDIKQGRLKRTYSQKLIENLDEVPFPDYENLDTHTKYLGAAVGGLNPRKWLDGKSVYSKRVGCIISARGCPFNCYFCYSNYLGQKYRCRSAANVVDEIDMLTVRYSVEYIHFCDELALTKERGYQFCTEMAKRKVKVLWGGAMRLDLLDEPTLITMKEQGLIHVGTGIESFSPRMLKLMNKNIKIERAKENLQMAKSILRDVQYTLIVGYPGEDEESLNATLRGVAEVGFPPEQAFFATAYPGTELYRYALDKEYIQDEASYLRSLSDHEQGSFPLLNFTNLPEDVLISAKKRLEGS